MMNTIILGVMTLVVILLAIRQQLLTDKLTQIHDQLDRAIDKHNQLVEHYAQFYRNACVWFTALQQSLDDLYREEEQPEEPFPGMEVMEAYEPEQRAS